MAGNRQSLYSRATLGGCVCKQVHAAIGPAQALQGAGGAKSYRTYRVRRKLWSIPLKKGFHRFHGLFSLFFIDAHSMFIRSGCHEMGSQCFPNLFFLMGCLSVGMAVGRHFGVCEDGG